MQAVNGLSKRTRKYLSMLLLLVSSRLVSCEEDVVTKFFTDYDKAIRPNFDQGKPTTIMADIYVESFGNIEEANMEYKAYTYFRQRWTDSRLAGKLNRTLTIKGGDIENIWVPDPYCYNARESNMMMPDEEIHSFVSIKSNGDVLYSKGVTLLASCIMNLRSFPHDSQECHLKFGSYSSTTEDIVFKWNATDVSVGTEEMAQFEYKGAKMSSDEDVFTTGNFSTVTVTFSFKRRIGYYLIQVYFPDMFVVALSWIVFWMDKDDMGNRMALGITTILTIVFLLGSLNGTLPKVSYPKALDWYLLTSFAFVFLSLVECMIVFCLNLSANGDKEQIKCKVNQIPISKKISQSLKSVIGTNKGGNSPKTNGHVVTNKSFEDDLEMVEQASKANKTVLDDAAIEEFIGTSKKEIAAEYTDKSSQVLFPLSFVIFNTVYWIYFSVTG